MAPASSHLVSTEEFERLLAEVEGAAPHAAEGIFGPESISWKINREAALFLAAGRAALLQLAHPWVAAAIAEHSRTLRDPVGRFHQTFRVMFTMVFGSTGQCLAAARQLHRRHQSIRGKMPETVGPVAKGSLYEANDLAALTWVHATLVDSALLAYELVLPPLTLDEREQCYREGRTMAALFGIPKESLPRNWTEFQTYFDSTLQSDSVLVSPTARAIAHQLHAGTGSWLHPPFWYRSLTTHLLPPRMRQEFQFDYGAREQRAAERAMRWLPRMYRALPPAVRFVGPYREAQARLAGKVRPSLAVRLSNRLWVGQPTLLNSDD